MKRITALILSVLLVVSILLCGCQDNNKNNSTNNNQNNKAFDNKNDKDDNKNDKDDNKNENENESAESIVTNKGEMPLIKEGEKATLSITVNNKNTDDFVNNDFTKYITEMTGVDITFNVLTYANLKEQFNIMMASGDYTDIIEGVGLSRAEQSVYAEEGIIIPLNDLYEDYSDHFSKALNEFGDEDELLRFFSLNDNKLYGFPNLCDTYHTKAKNKMWIYKPWLDVLGLDVPQTTEEFYQTLKAFKEEDPNGNGIADEIPYAGAAKGWNTQADLFLMNAFELNNYDGNDNLYLDGNKVYSSIMTEEWKDGLKWMNKLYSEGLMAPETFTQDNKQLMLLGENEVPILGAASAGSPAIFTQVGAESNRWLEYVPVPILENPDGRRENIFMPTYGSQYSSYITDKAEIPELAFRFLDNLMNVEDDVYYLAEFGLKDVNWRHAEEGELGLNDEQGILRIFSNPERTTSWKQQSAQVQTEAFRIGRVYDRPHIEHILFTATRDAYLPYAVDSSVMLPLDLICPEELSAELVDLKTNIETYEQEMTARFVIGDYDIDAEWDNYIKELNNIGMERYIEIVQSTYDERYSK